MNESKNSIVILLIFLFFATGLSDEGKSSKKHLTRSQRTRVVKADF